MTATILKVTGMTCGGCERALERALGALDGVAAVAASHERRTVSITFDPARLTPADLARRIEALGYQVQAP